MFARSSTIRAQPSKIDAGIEYLRDEAMPTMQGMAEFVGLSLLVDRESGRCIATSSWQSEQAMRASAVQMKGIRDRGSEVLGGAAEVQEWEIAVMHRAHPAPEGACVRATWSRIDPERADRGIDTFRLGALPRIEELDGFCSASLLIDRVNGRGVSTVTFDSRQAMDRSREQGAAIRAAAMREAGIELIDTGEFELALAHLRVPEMA